MWEEAEKLTVGEWDVLRCVRLSRMSVDYAIVERACAAFGRGRVELLTARPPVIDLARSRFEPFMQTLEHSGMTHLREWKKLDFPQYRDTLPKTLGVKKQ